MNDFYTALNYLTNKVYQPIGLSIDAVKEEKQNAKYGAGVFRLLSRTVRFRVAKITPTKTGQFVAFWEKDEHDKNQAYAYEKFPDFFVITTFKNKEIFGQFIFPKEVLRKHNILRTTEVKGKMGLRVYPDWDEPTSQQAIKTLGWQRDYFVDFSNPNKLPVEKMKQLFAL